MDSKGNSEENCICSNLLLYIIITTHLYSKMYVCACVWAWTNWHAGQPEYFLKVNALLEKMYYIAEMLFACK